MTVFTCPTCPSCGKPLVNQWLQLGHPIVRPCPTCPSYIPTLGHLGHLGHIRQLGHLGQLPTNGGAS